MGTTPDWYVKISLALLSLHFQPPTNYPSHTISSFAMPYPMTPQPGNVSTQASTISRTTLRLIADALFSAPTPMMAVVFTWVVLTGIPHTVESRIQSAADRSAANWYHYIFCTALSIYEKQPKQENSQELLTVLGSVHECHRRRAGHLCF